MQDDAENDGLARLREEPEGRGRYGLPSRLRSMEITWERGVLALAAILIVCAVVGAVVVLTRSRTASNGEHQQQRVSRVLAATRTPRRATPTSTPPPTTAPAVVTAGPPDRTDCDAIRGTDYRSEAEHQYYLAHCLTPQSAPASASTRPGSRPTLVGPPPPTPPGPEPTVPPAFGASDAMAVASDWISNDAAVAYTTDPGLCNAVLIAGRWIVTCQATLTGCSIGPECQANVTVCVLVDPIAVRPADQC